MADCSSRNFSPLWDRIKVSWGRCYTSLFVHQRRGRGCFMDNSVSRRLMLLQAAPCQSTICHLTHSSSRQSFTSPKLCGSLRCLPLTLMGSRLSCPSRSHSPSDTPTTEACWHSHSSRCSSTNNNVLDGCIHPAILHSST